LIDPFEKKQLKSTKIYLPKLGFGGAPVSGLSLGSYGGVKEEEALEIIEQAYTRGIRYFDTAPLYGTGNGEKRYSKILSNKQREDFSISTKCGRIILSEKEKNDSPKPKFLPGVGYTGDENIRFDFSKDGIRRSLEESLQRLKLDYIDILLLHDADVENLEKEASKTAFPAMLKLRDEGIVKAIGCGMNQWEMPSRFIDEFDLDVVLLAGRFTLLDHSSFEKFLPKCLDKDVKIILGGPFNSGILADDNLGGNSLFNYGNVPKDILIRAKKLSKISKKYNIPLKAAALQYVMSHPAVISTIPGPENIKELLNNIENCNLYIPENFWIDLIENNLIPKNAFYPK
jgi:D-threo-aldose 1-dehydrogenase